MMLFLSTFLHSKVPPNCQGCTIWGDVARADFERTRKPLSERERAMGVTANSTNLLAKLGIAAFGFRSRNITARLRPYSPSMHQPRQTPDG